MSLASLSIQNLKRLGELRKVASLTVKLEVEKPQANDPCDSTKFLENEVNQRNFHSEKNKGVSTKKLPEIGSLSSAVSTSLVNSPRIQSPR